MIRQAVGRRHSAGEGGDDGLATMPLRGRPEINNLIPSMISVEIVYGYAL